MNSGCFKILPFSAIVGSMELNPFETETVLRKAPVVENVSEMAGMNRRTDESAEMMFD